MDIPWFERNKRGRLRVIKRDGTWYVDEPETTGETVCFFTSGELSTESDTESVSVRVESYKRGVGSGTNYLRASLLEPDGAAESISKRDLSDSTTQISSTTSSTSSQGSYPERTLVQFRGTGDFVTVEAKIHSIEYVKKNIPNMPDMKGILREDGSVKKLPFVVEQGVTHPYFETGMGFRFQGVKDHKYKNEIQALITDETTFIEL